MEKRGEKESNLGRINPLWVMGYGDMGESEVTRMTSGLLFQQQGAQRSHTPGRVNKHISESLFLRTCMWKSEMHCIFPDILDEENLTRHHNPQTVFWLFKSGCCVCKRL